MRALFAQRLHRYLTETPEARLLTADIGYGVLDSVRSEHRAQCVDFGAAEQLMLGAACGMALSGLKPICYSITPFLLYRPFEWIRNFLNHDKISVRLACVGRGRDYGPMGFTHWADDMFPIMGEFTNIRVFTGAEQFDQFFSHDGPAYISIRK